MNYTEFQVTINVPPLLEEPMVDCLLAIDSDGFSSLNVNAHTIKHEQLSLVEQVSGRQKQVRFQMYVKQPQLQPLLEHLKQNFAGAGIQYWVLPVLERGHI